MLKTIPNSMTRFGMNDSFGSLFRDMDRLFDMTTAPKSSLLGSASRAKWPGLNVWRDDDQMVAEAEIPGFRMEDIEVLAGEDSVTIRGHRSESTPEGATPLRIERSVSSFERSFRTPVQIDPDAVEATLENGVLRVMLPIAESARPRRVQIKALTSGPEREALPSAATSGT